MCLEGTFTVKLDFEDSRVFVRKLQEPCADSLSCFRAFLATIPVDLFGPTRVACVLHVVL